MVNTSRLASTAQKNAAKSSNHYLISTRKLTQTPPASIPVQTLGNPVILVEAKVAGTLARHRTVEHLPCSLSFGIVDNLANASNMRPSTYREAPSAC